MIAALIISLTLLLFAAYIVVMNWGCAIVSLRNKRRGIDERHSTVPLVSFLITAIAIVFYPRPHKAWMLAVPLLDVGNWSVVLGMLWLPVILVRSMRKKQDAAR